MAFWKFTVFVFAAFTLALSDAEKLQYQLNPDCPQNICTDGLVNLLHVQNVQPNYTVHFMLTSGMNIGLPTVLLLRTPNSGKVTFNWTKLADADKSGGITVDPLPDFTASMSLLQLIVYDDVNKTAQLPHPDVPNEISTLNLDSIHWSDPQISQSNDELFVSLKTSNGSKNANFTGEIELKVSIGLDSMRATELPRLLYTGENSIINIYLRNLDSPYNDTRFALQFLMATKRPRQVNDDFNVQEVFSVDDEYTPGIFKVSSLQLSPLQVPLSESVFLQWKRVCYTSTAYTVKDTTQMSMEDKQFLNSEDHRMNAWQNSAAFAMWGDALWFTNTTSAWAINVTFGQPEDGFYKKTNFTSWSVSFGVGDYPQDQVSVLVIMVILCGFGLPVVLIIFGVAFVFFRRWRRGVTTASYTDYEPINT